MAMTTMRAAAHAAQHASHVPARPARRPRPLCTRTSRSIARTPPSAKPRDKRTARTSRIAPAISASTRDGVHPMGGAGNAAGAGGMGAVPLIFDHLAEGNSRPRSGPPGECYATNDPAGSAPNRSRPEALAQRSGGLARKDRFAHISGVPHAADHSSLAAATPLGEARPHESTSFDRPGGSHGRAAGAPGLRPRATAHRAARFHEHDHLRLAQHRPRRHGRPRRRHRRHPESVEDVLRRGGGRRHLEDDERRHDLPPGVRQRTRRVDGCARDRAERHESGVGRHGRAEHAQLDLPGRRRLQDHRRRQDLEVHGPREDAADRAHRRASRPIRTSSTSRRSATRGTRTRSAASYKTTDGGKTWKLIEVHQRQGGLRRRRDGSVEPRRRCRRRATSACAARTS